MATGRLSNFDIARLASNTSKKETASEIIKRSATSSWIMGRPRPSLRRITDTAENSAAIITTKISSRQPARGSLALKKIFRRKKFAGGGGGIAWPEGAGVTGASLFILFSPTQHHGKLKRRCPAARHFLCKHTACRRSSISRKKSPAAA